MVFIMGLFNKDIMRLFTSNEITNVSVIKNIMYVGIIIYGLYIVINYVINIKLFEKGVNVD